MLAFGRNIAKDVALGTGERPICRRITLPDVQTVTPRLQIIHWLVLDAICILGPVRKG